MEEEIKKLISITSWFISLQIITLIAFLGGAAVIYADLTALENNLIAGLSAARAPAVPTEVENWREYVRSHNAVSTTANAEIEVLEFTDFQCPFCRTFSEGTRHQIQSKYGDRVRFTFKHNPIEAIHPFAKQAAVAAQCALRQGKFWEIQDIFFGNPDALSTEGLLEAGASLGLGEPYEECIKTEATLAEVEQDMRDGSALGFKGTPTFVVNGQVTMGAISLTEFNSIVERLGN